MRFTQCVTRGRIAIESDAGTSTLTGADSDGSTVELPAYAATTTRDGPGGSFAFHAPSALVTTVAARLYWLPPSLGAVKIWTVCPGSAFPVAVPSHPLTATAER